jgi:ribosomal protein L3 glutamine methyltransferase
MMDLPDEYHQEPELGLAAGSDGLDFVRIIVDQAASFLAPGGILVVEIGSGWFRAAERWPHLPFHWQTFKRGGEGVFILTAEELRAGSRRSRRVGEPDAC